MKTSDITVEMLREACARKDYLFFEKGDYNINIIGIRTKDNAANTFNDVICYVYKQSGRWVLFTLDGTTDPGRFWRLNPMNELGTAVLVPGQYLGAYTLGLHKGKYPAFIQSKALPVYRDADQDGFVDTDGEIDLGWHGINIHPRSENSTGDEIGKWSAGCQVPEHYYEHMMCYYAAKHAETLYGKRFSYTLLEEKDL